MPNTTHVVLPALSRSFRVVCALAAGARLVRPSFVDECASLGFVSADPALHEWTTDGADPRLNASAGALWRSRRAAGKGGALQGVHVVVVGELAPRARQGAVTSDMAKMLLAAAGAVVVEETAEACFAVVSDAVATHPIVAKLRGKNVPCFGPALLIDLVSRVEICPPDYLAFRDQVGLVTKQVTVYDAEHAPVIPLEIAQHIRTKHATTNDAEHALAIPPTLPLASRVSIPASNVCPAPSAVDPLPASAGHLGAKEFIAHDAMHVSIPLILPRVRRLATPASTGGSAPSANDPKSQSDAHVPTRPSIQNQSSSHTDGNQPANFPCIKPPATQSQPVNPARFMVPASIEGRTVTSEMPSRRKSNEIYPRKRPRCIIGESPPSDNEEDKVKAGEGDDHTAHPVVISAPSSPIHERSITQTAEPRSGESSRGRSAIVTPDGEEKRQTVAVKSQPVSPAQFAMPAPIEAITVTSGTSSRRKSDDLCPRKRPRRIIRESPPSDSEEEENSEGEMDNHTVCPVVLSATLSPIHERTIEQTVGSRSRESSKGSAVMTPDGQQMRQTFQGPTIVISNSSDIEKEYHIDTQHSNDDRLSFGSSSFRERGRIRSTRAASQPNRRRIQLRTPDSNATPHSSKRRFVSDVESTAHDTTSVIESELPVIDLGGDLGVGDSFDLVMAAIGGPVTEDQVQRLTSTRAHDEFEPKVAKGPRAAQGGAMYDESPQDVDMDDDSSSHYGVEPNIHASTVPQNVPVTRARANNAHSLCYRENSTRSDGTSTVPGCGALDLPTTMETPTLIIPEYLSTLSAWPMSSNVAAGIEEDDKLVQESVEYKDWIFSAEHLDLDAESRESLQRVTHTSSVLDASSSIRLMRDANVLSHLVSLSDIGASRMKTVLGICTRLLHAALPENLLLLFIDLLMRGRDSQLEKGRDSLVYLLSSSGRQMRGRHEYLQFVWVAFLDACRREESSMKGSLLWKLFNESWFKNTSRFPAQKDATTYAAMDDGVQNLLNALSTISGLFAFQIDKPVAAIAAPDVELTPNWTAAGKAIDALVERKYSSFAEHGKVMSRYLVRVCTEFADRLWKVEEDFVLQVLRAVQSLCVKYDDACFCKRIPIFLTQFQGIADIRARRRSIRDYLKTTCDCALFLAWIYIAQQPDVSPRHHAKIARHSAMFMKAKGCSKNPARALTHHLGLTMSIAESILKARGGREELFRATLFSKAPDVSKAVDDPFAFDPTAIDSWESVLETIKLRCRHLLASKRSIHVYSDYICSNLTSALIGIEKPDARFTTDVKKREAWRVQQRVFAELILKLLTAFVDILKLVVEAVESGSYLELEAIDALLKSLSRFIGRLGRFAVGLVSQVRSNQSGSISTQRNQMLSIIILFVEQGLYLCTVHAQLQIRLGVQGTLIDYSAIASQAVSQAPHKATTSFGHFARIVQSSMLTALVSLLQCPVSEAESVNDFELRLVAGRAVARTIGLCSIGPTPVYTIHTSNQLMQVVSAANLTVLNLGSKNAPGTMHRQSGVQSVNRGGKERELLMQAEFWSVLLDSTWSSSVLPLSEKLEEMVFSLWIIMLVVSYAESDESRLVKALPILSYAIQSACRRNDDLKLGKWFYATQFGRKCQEMASIGPAGNLGQGAHTVTELDAQDRLEALVDCLCVVLQSWVTSKVLNLVDWIRSYIKLSSSFNARRFAEGQPSQMYFLPTRDIQDGEQALLYTQVLAVLFVVHSSLGLPSLQYRGGRGSSFKSVAKLYLTEITDSLTKALNKMRKRRNANTESAYSHIQMLIIVGLATVGYDQRDVETRISFLRFLRLIATADSLSSLFTWNDTANRARFLRRTPFSFIDADPSCDAARRRLIEKCGREWRQMAFHTLVEDPLSRAAVTSQEFRGALRCLCELLQPSISANLRETGLWNNVCFSMRQIDRRKQSPELRELFESIPQMQLLDQLWRDCN